jgi:ATP-dependent DNA helicase RecG
MTVHEYLSKELKFLPGVGPKRAELLAAETRALTFRDLLFNFPFKYVDRTRFFQVRDIHPDLPYIQLKGKITSFKLLGDRFKQRLVANFSDGTGIVELVFFKGIKFIQQSYQVGVEYIVFGKPTVFSGRVNLVHPEMDSTLKQETMINASLQAYYSVSEKLKSGFITSKIIHKFQNNLIQGLPGEIPETLPAYLVQQERLLSLHDTLVNLHFPVNYDMLKRAEYRIKFEELFYIQLGLLRQKFKRVLKSDGFVFGEVGRLFNQFYSDYLPFPLTAAQKRVMKEIRRDLGSGKQMNRLLQGDVGSGKTLVALMSLLLAIDNGYQGCLMAPTEILANQHFKSIQALLGDMDLGLAVLTGSTPKAQRTLLHEGLMNGSIKLLLGTHALIEETVQFTNLGLVVIDEQHRFGVEQRARLWQKNEKPPHVMVMTATPIPRTLAMTVYGDLEVSVIDELPPGRKPVHTQHYYDSNRLKMFGFLRKQLEQGRQVYIVYPLIEGSEKMDYKDLTDGYESISRDFPPPEHVVTVLHGKMKSKDKEESMRQFVSGQAHIMVATTVIEVGVNVPNASVMVIESAERFGLSQLHQLRGRVGRGADQSFCILMTSYKLSKEARQRIETMVRTNDGFEIAEVDLKLRGPGDIEGTQQSGVAFDLKLANLARDGQIIQLARDVATGILDKDPELTDPGNEVLLANLNAGVKTKLDWSVIS